MKVVVGSRNVPKIQATKHAFNAAFDKHKINVVDVSTESKVSSHPTSAEESLRGAINRASHARQLIEDADYYVGIEGGLLISSERAWEIGWIVISDAHGQIATGLSSGIELSGPILEAVMDGVELNDVLE